MRCTKGQRLVLIGAWMLVLASTLFPPATYHLANGDKALWCQPIWKIAPGNRQTYTTVDVSRLGLVWIWIALATVAGVWAFRPRWHRPSRCDACGYSLAGLARDAVCPECGAAARK